MAEVLVTTQTIPIMNLHSTDAFHGHSHSSSQSHHNSSSRSTNQVSRQYGSVPYRGGPVAPYAFQSTPSLSSNSRQNAASAPAPAAHRQSIGPNTLANNRQSYAPSSSASTASSNSASNASSNNTGQYTLGTDITTPSEKPGARPESTFLTSSSTPDLSLISFDTSPTAKPSPDRYRRSTKRNDSSSSGAGNANAANTGSGNQRWSQQWPTPQAAHQAMNKAFSAATSGHSRSESADDVHKQQAGLGRYRRRSVGPLEPQNTSRPATTPMQTNAPAPAPTWSQIAARAYSGMQQPGPSPSLVGARPIAHQRTDSAGSHASNGSDTVRRPSQGRQESYTSTRSNSSNRPSTAPAHGLRPVSRNGANGGKRVISPSPLSKPAGPSEAEKLGVPKPPASPDSRPTSAVAPTPAVARLEALRDADPNKGMKSRLRRAFSFGSAQELRKASAKNQVNKMKQEQEPNQEGELQGEDAKIAAQQEAAGFGSGIYSGQGGVYGSTDNLSIQSTASSASVMLRKMGRGVKKSTKSLRGLFRPKSIIGDPAADEAVAPPSAVTAEVSLVTVKAESHRVNVDVHPSEHAHGETGYPKLERNSMDGRAIGLERPTSSRHGQSDSVSSRRSIIGGDRERQEVLNAVKKGILKRNNTSSPVPAEPNPSDLTVPSVPSTPTSQKEQPTFFIATNAAGNNSTKSLPAGVGNRNISWNPKVQFFDVWAPNEYDRRGDIATCNRLTPMLAQQIKEELNTFKMEMEVHEMSKPHTHFF